MGMKSERTVMPLLCSSLMITYDDNEDYSDDIHFESTSIPGSLRIFVSGLPTILQSHILGTS